MSLVRDMRVRVAAGQQGRFTTLVIRPNDRRFLLVVFGLRWDAPGSEMLREQLRALVEPGQQRRAELHARWKVNPNLDNGGLHLWRVRALGPAEAIPEGAVSRFDL